VQSERNGEKPPVPAFVRVVGIASVGTAALLPVALLEQLASAGPRTSGQVMMTGLLPAIVLFVVGGLTLLARRAVARAIIVFAALIAAPGSAIAMRQIGASWGTTGAIAAIWLILASVTALYVSRSVALRTYFEKSPDDNP
jgi:hypothetical protein